MFKGVYLFLHIHKEKERRSHKLPLAATRLESRSDSVPTSWAVMSEGGDADCAASQQMRNGVKFHRNFLDLFLLHFLFCVFLRCFLFFDPAYTVLKKEPSVSAISSFFLPNS